MDHCRDLISRISGNMFLLQIPGLKRQILAVVTGHSPAGFPLATMDILEQEEMPQIFIIMISGNMTRRLIPGHRSRALAELHAVPLPDSLWAITGTWERDMMQWE